MCIASNFRLKILDVDMQTTTDWLQEKFQQPNPRLHFE